MIKRQIDQGTFSFTDEFLDYRFLRRLKGTSKLRLCDDVFDEYLAHCEARLRRDDLAAATVRSYRKILDGVWRPQIGKLIFYEIGYSQLVAIAEDMSGARIPTTTPSAFSDAPLTSDIGTGRSMQTQPGACVVLAFGKLTVRKSTRFACKTPRRSSLPFIETGARRRETTTSLGSSRDSGPPSRSRSSFRISTLKMDRRGRRSSRRSARNRQARARDFETDRTRAGVPASEAEGVRVQYHTNRMT